MKELIRVAGAVLQQGRYRIAASVDLNGVEIDFGRLDVVAGDFLTCVNVRGIGVPAILRVQAVRHQNDDLLVFEVRIHGGHGERPAADKRHPPDLQANPLIGVARG